MRAGSAGGGNGEVGPLGLRARDDVEEFERDTDLREEYDAFRGGKGGAAPRWFAGGDSKWMRGVDWDADCRIMESDTCLTAPFVGGFVPTGFF